MKKLISVMLSLAMLLSLCAGAMAETVDVSGTTIEVAVTYTGEPLEMFQKVVDEYQKANNCKVEVSVYGTDYEATLKTRMANEDLPDVWMTHGWSLIRYSEYLMPLNDQPWVANYDPSAFGVIQNKDGNLYVLMVNEMVLGTLVNLDTCEAAGVDPYAINTFDEFEVACEKLKQAGYTPIVNGVGAGSMANIAGAWLSYEGEMIQASESMLDGTFDWNNYKVVCDAWTKWVESGYLFEDVLTLNGADGRERFATGKAAFYLGNDTGYAVTCRLLNPDGNYAIIPVFASAENGTRFVGIGEGDAFGIWKDTKNEAAAKAFINYLATPEIAERLNSVSGNVSALTNVKPSNNEYGAELVKTMQAKFPNAYYENLWDRQYMPSGMWSIFGTAGNMLFADHSEAGIQEVLDYLAENYLDLYEAALEN